MLNHFPKERCVDPMQTLIGVNATSCRLPRVSPPISKSEGYPLNQHLSSQEWRVIEDGMNQGPGSLDPGTAGNQGGPAKGLQDPVQSLLLCPQPSGVAGVCVCLPYLHRACPSFQM